MKTMRRYEQQIIHTRARRQEHARKFQQVKIATAPEATWRWCMQTAQLLHWTTRRATLLSA